MHTHKQDRLKSAKDNLHTGPHHKPRPIVSVEKQFCLDIPNGSSHNCIGKLLETHYFSTKHNECGSVIVGDCFSANCNLKLIAIEGLLLSARYYTNEGTEEQISEKFTSDTKTVGDEAFFTFPPRLRGLKQPRMSTVGRLNGQEKLIEFYFHMHGLRLCGTRIRLKMKSIKKKKKRI